MIVDERCICVHGRQSVHHRRQFLVVNPDQVNGLLGSLLINGGHGSHGIANEPNFVQSQIGFVAPG